mmetsp:Transcript_8935/g.22321  ORF Transcript_8935/g.22321 Transcript_8935/m.22321 type:complete len:218 (+) Transcript_8935:204-857(+)
MDIWILSLVHRWIFGFSAWPSQAAHLLGHLPQPKLLHLPRRRLRQLAEHIRLGHLKTRQVPVAELPHLFLSDVMCSLPELHEDTRRLPPLVVGARNSSSKVDGGVHQNHLLNLDRRDILPPTNNNVLRPVLQLQIAVGVHNTNVPRVVPTPLEILICRFGVLKVAFHDHVAPKHDLPPRQPICWNRLHGLGIHQLQVLQTVVTHPLPSPQLRLLPHA